MMDEYKTTGTDEFRGGPEEYLASLQEHRRLRERIAELEAENARLRAEAKDRFISAAHRRDAIERQLGAMREAAQAILDDPMSDCRKSLAERLQAALAPQPPAQRSPKYFIAQDAFYATHPEHRPRPQIMEAQPPAQVVGEPEYDFSELSDPDSGINIITGEPEEKSGGSKL